MSSLHWPARLYIASLTLVTVSAMIVLLIPVAPPTPGEVGLAFSLVGFMVMAWLHPFPLSYKRKLTIDTSVLTAAVLLFRPGSAMLIAGVGILLAHAIRHEDWVQATFNAAQTMLQAAAGGLLLAVFSGEDQRSFLLKPQAVPLIVVVGIAFFVVGNLCVATMVALQGGMRPLLVWYRTARNVSREEYVGHLVQVGLGSVGALLIRLAPWMVPLLLLPAIIISRLLGRSMELRWQSEAALRGRDQSLAEVQRIAHLGSWEWDLTTGHVVWSEEMYRILGLTPSTLTPTYEAFLLAIPPADRTRVDRAIEEALYAGERFQIDHRVRWQDGIERVVHLQGEVLMDEAGDKSCVVGTIQDVTERKTLEAHVEEMTERERTAAELAEARRRLAASRETETLRLARDLHDGPVQDLLAISYRLAGLRQSVHIQPPTDEPASVLDTLRRDVLEVVGDLRGLIGELRPPGLAEFGLPAALNDYVEWLLRTDGEDPPNIVLDLDDSSAHLPQPLALTLFRVAQEALRNALRHAAARRVTVRLRQQLDEVVLQVSDDGRGFEVPPRLSAFAETGHFGLVGMAERVGQVGGELTVESSPTTGTMLQVRLPLGEPGTGDDRADSSPACR